MMILSATEAARANARLERKIVAVCGLIICRLFTANASARARCRFVEGEYHLFTVKSHAQPLSIIQII